MSSPKQRIRRVRVYFIVAMIVFSAGWLTRLMPRSSGQSRSASDTAEERHEGARCRVDRVVDGDTLVLVCGGVRERVRLLHINTPEKDAPGGAEATAALTRLVASEEIQLVHEGRESEPRDRHDRLLAYVLAGDRNVNVELVRQGFSRFWTRYGRGTLATEFEAAEGEARRSGAGLWSDGVWNRQGTKR